MPNSIECDGVDDQIIFAGVPAAIQVSGAHTLLVVVRIINTNDGLWGSFLETETSAAGSAASIGRSNGGQTYWAQGVTNGLEIATTDSQNWIIGGAGKPAGVSVPRLHQGIVGGANTHTPASEGTLAASASITGGTIRLGGNDDFLNERFAAAAIWDRDLTDGEWNSINAALTTASIIALSPVWCVDALDSFAVDYMGNLNRSAAGGSSSSDGPAGWVYGTGAAAPTYPQAVQDFNRTRFPFAAVPGMHRRGITHDLPALRAAGNKSQPLPGGGFERFIFPRLHGVYSTQQFIDLIAASELNTAQALTKFKSDTLGVVTEIDVAQVIAKFKSKALGVATVTHTAQAITKFKSKSVGVATEADAAQALSITHVHFKTLGVATELDVSQALTKIKSKLLGTVTQANTAQTLNVDKIKVLIPATETDTAQLLSFSQGSGDILMTLTPATEADVAQTLLKFKSVSIGPASSLNAAQVLTHLKRVTLGLATETDTAQTLIHLKRLSLSPVVTTNVAQALTRYKSKTLGVVSESDIAQAFVYTKTIFRTLNPALEFDVAVPLTIAGQEVVIVYRYRGPIIIGRF